MMEKQAKIYVAGHTGMVGSATVDALKKAGYENIIVRSHQELDLTESHEVRDFFEKEKPEYVFVAAAKVGGIIANNTYPADFIHENIAIANNVIHQAYKSNVKKLLFLGSSCIYPKFAPQPMKEEYLLTGAIEPTNEPYALAKISGIKMCQSYNRQYGTNFIAVMPTNLYGPRDNFDLQNSHIIPALIQKFHTAKINGDKEAVAWGTGMPRREFLYIDDMADGCIFLMNHFNPTKEQNQKGEIFLNLGLGTDISIKELTELVKSVVGFTGTIVWDTTKPDGAPQKLLEVSKMDELGWRYSVELREGLEKTYQWFLEKNGTL